MSQVTIAPGVEIPKKANSVADVVMLLNAVGDALFKGPAVIHGVNHNVVFDAAYYLESHVAPLEQELNDTEQALWKSDATNTMLERSIDKLAAFFDVKIEEGMSYTDAVDAIEAKAVELKEAGVAAIDAAYAYDEDPQVPEWRSLMTRIAALEKLCR